LPVTPLHYCVAYVAKRLDRHLSLPALTVGSLIPDLENPVIYLLFRLKILNLDVPYELAADRLVLHSLIGASTLGLGLTLIVTIYLYPRISSALFGVDALEACRPSWGLVASAFLGCVSHVLLDALHHPYNPLLYPLTASSVDTLVLFGNPAAATILVHLVCLALTAAILVYEWGRGDFWTHLLVNPS